MVCLFASCIFRPGCWSSTRDGTANKCRQKEPPKHLPLQRSRERSRGSGKQSFSCYLSPLGEHQQGSTAPLPSYRAVATLLTFHTLLQVKASKELCPFLPPLLVCILWDGALGDPPQKKAPNLRESRKIQCHLSPAPSSHNSSQAVPVNLPCSTQSAVNETESHPPPRHAV